jgi:hypothetical protein
MDEDPPGKVIGFYNFIGIKFYPMLKPGKAKLQEVYP